MTTILVADDDANIRRLIRLYLENDQFRVIEALDGEEALEKMKEQPVSLAIIDVMMPKVNGWEVTRFIRQSYTLPILIVTAKGESSDKIEGFNAGTDDYLVKPFDPVELVLRVKALLNRYELFTAQEVQIGPYVIQKDKLKVTSDRTEVALKRKECELLFHLAKFPGTIFTRDQLIQLIWGHDYEGDDRTVDVHIKRLREKIRPFEGLSIRTIRGLGYTMEEYG
ncbi:DNA-binding response regulator [Geomicrobium sp. JCM 19037]|uniref:response regulator transcription factor n=1 Tax=unclassified Geomicrobium TaxID=2628951 RepID=UPI00045F11C9|nr:response regulator transcription factor [Geomicrobium sp. JCM 19037]GAK05612.1 DNA-binding response regulator [Geomicrobium sp. JCM 19037]